VEKQGKIQEAEPKQGWFSSWWSGGKKTDEEDKQGNLSELFFSQHTIDFLFKNDFFDFQKNNLKKR
jgi:hypothetical protein